MSNLTARSINFATLMDELGQTVTSSTNSSNTSSSRHRAPSTTTAKRSAASLAAGAAIVGGAAFAAAPVASAQSSDPAAIVETLRQAALDAGIQIPTNIPLPPEVAEYAGTIGVGSADAFVPGSLGGHVPTIGILTSNFGARWGTQHNGIDIGAPIGTPMYAAKTGTVIAAGPASGYGLWIRIQSDDGFMLEYGHNNANYVQVGQRVSAGQIVGEVGNRGNSTGPHLHFGVKAPNGVWIDPIPFMAANGVLM